MNLEHRLRLHTWGLFNTYDGKVDAVAEAACEHGGHVEAADSWACLASAILWDFVKQPANREALVATLAGASESPD